MNTQNIDRDERKQRNRPFCLTLAIGFICLSLLACQPQTQTPKSDTKPPAAKTETVANWPPKVTQIDEQGLKALLKPDGKPRLINFWATWCGPCREEFPDLVKIGKDHKDKIELVTVTLDEPSEINGDVPKFLEQMKSDSAAYLLKAKDPDAAITMVSKDWQGALPFTLLLNAAGEPVYSKQGKFDTNALVAEIGKF